ncbi:MAG: LysR family transcriptional regulator [Planctomycetes bacterium]|nr:LysR family transcriptional regulator [Planctomycetota bacterium]
MDVTLRQLEYAVAVARLGHFGRAAEASLATQPALSAGIAQLEAVLGVPLFERGRSGARPTVAGAEIVRRAEEVLARVDDLRDAARAVRGPFATPLRLGVIPTVAPFVLPKAVPALRAHWPKLRLELREDQTARLVHALGEGSIDVALLAEEADLGGMETLRLYADPFVLAVPAGHRLAGRARASERVLQHEQVLLLEEGHCLRTQALSFCERLGVRESADVRATSLTTLVHMAAGGLGVTLLPAMASSLGLGAGLTLVPFGSRAPSRTIVLAFRPTTARRDELRAVADVLRSRPPAGTVSLRA